MRGGAGFCRTCFFNSRPQNRGAAAVLGGAARLFLVWAARLFLVWAVRRQFWAARRRFLACAAAAVLGGAARRFLVRAARRLFAQPFGGALAPLGSPPCFVSGFAPCFAAVIPRAGLCAGLLCRARARIINFSLI